MALRQRGVEFVKNDTDLGDARKNTDKFKSSLPCDNVVMTDVTRVRKNGEHDQQEITDSAAQIKVLSVRLARETWEQSTRERIVEDMSS